MTITAWGKKYADAVHNGKIIWPTGVPAKRRAETYAAYTELGYKPDIEPPTDEE